MPKVIKVLADLPHSSKAIVNVVDDGGSSGRLRQLLKVLPPGDSRNCINATATNSSLAEIFDFRFSCDEELDNHSLGNLIIAALQHIKGDFKSAIDVAGELLGARIEVIPATNEPITLLAKTVDGQHIEGQKHIALTSGIKVVKLDPPSPKAEKTAKHAIEASDVAIIGPGSLYSSIIPTLLIPEIKSAILTSKPKIIYISNTVSHRKETFGMSLEEHVNALLYNCPYLKIDIILAQDNEALVKQFADLDSRAIRILHTNGGIEDLRIVYNDLVDPENPRQHCIKKLSGALADILDEL